jgi:GNAT superfamily N-acetyltransferase
MFEITPKSNRETFVSRMPEHWEKTVLNVSHSIRGETHRAVINFLNVQLRSAGTFSVNDEYPSLFGEFPGGESLVIKLNGHIASHVGLLVREFQHPAFRLRVGLIGSVATATEFQGRGFATELVNQAMIQLRRKGCAIALLWSENLDFYSSFGFVRAGRELDLQFRAHDLPEFAEKPVPFNLKTHGHKLWRLYQKHDVKLDRSLEEQKRLCAVPNMKIFVTEKNDAVTSYLAIGKGADFSNYVHEWAGETEDLLINLSGVAKKYYPDTVLTLLAPAHYPLNGLRRLALQENRGVLGLMKIVDKQSLMNRYCHYLRSCKIEHTWDRENGIFSSHGAEIKLNQESDYLRLVFEGIGQEAEAPERLSSKPTAAPFFLWGLDSI